jgi:hypothetical protein
MLFIVAIIMSHTLNHVAKNPTMPCVLLSVAAIAIMLQQRTKREQAASAIKEPLP